MANVLVIDDETDVRDSLREVIKRAGHEVRVAADAVRGLEALRDQPAQIAIVDIIMPGQNGVEVIATIREEFPDTRIVAISGGGNIVPLAYEPKAINTTAYLASAEKAGADVTLTKPFKRQDVLRVIGQLTTPKSTRKPP